MSLTTLRRVAQCGLTRNIVPSTSSGLACPIRHASTAEQIKKRLYDSSVLRLPMPTRDVETLNRRLQFRLNDRNIVGIVRLWTTAIENGVRPNAVSYDTMLKVIASYGLFDLTVKIFEDMLKMKVGDKQQGLNYVLESAAADPSLEAKAFKMFEEHGCSWNEITYQHILEALARRENVEMAVQVLSEMFEKGITPNVQSIQTVICLAAQMGMPQFAMEMAIKAERFPGVNTDQVRMAVLMSGAETMNANVVQKAWDYIRRTRCPPTEPLCVEILNTAARHGLPELACSVLEYLQESSQEIQEHHLAAVIGSYAVAGQIRDAYLALDLFKDHRVKFLPESASGLVEVIARSSETLDNAWDLLTQLPRPVNIEAVNTTIEAATNLSDMQRAIGIYKELPDLEVSPDAQTFDILLGGCLSISHAELGERLYQDMLSNQIRPTLQTYSRLILLALTQETYESAFSRLEEIKGRNMIPPQRVYEALVQRCVEEGDPRAELALEDMEICGYRVSTGLRDYLLKSQKKQDTANEAMAWVKSVSS
ncbi:pentatricopeptide repeat protein, partial [Rhizoctonia solani]